MTTYTPWPHGGPKRPPLVELIVQRRLKSIEALWLALLPKYRRVAKSKLNIVNGIAYWKNEKGSSK